MIVMMGVSGAGKSAVGTALAARLDVPFCEGDPLHPPTNVQRMRAGVPLTDADRAPWLVAILVARYRRPGLVLAAAALALAANYTLASVAGMMVAPLLSPNAGLLLLAVSLLLAASGMVLRAKTPNRLAGWKLGGFATSLLGMVILAFGDSTQFIAAALAARSPVPWLAAVGATLGALAVVVPAAVLGEAGWRALPLRAIRWTGAGVLGVGGVVLGLQAARLV